eukprot:Nk52_evm89s226 gene=Nk52_evmTU89s226
MYGDRNCGLEDLPVEVCLRILSFLDLKDLLVCQRTCRMLNELAKSPFLYKKLDFSPWGNNNYCQGITLSPSLIFTMLRLGGAGVVHISLKGCSSNVTDSVLYGIKRHCRNVCFLDLSECVCITDKGLIELATTCSLIETLNLRNCSELTIDGLKAAFMALPNLSWLSLSRMFQLNEENIGEVVGNYCPNLEYLNSCRIDLSDSSILAISKGCSKLKGVHLSYNDRITHVGVLHLLAYCPQIEHLALRCCHLITDVAVQYLGRHSATGTAVTTYGFVFLKHLDLSYCHTNIDNESILCIASTCHELQYIDLSGLVNVSSSSMVALAESCPNLKHVDVAGVQKLDDTFTLCLSSLKNLSYLDIGNCWKIKGSRELKSVAKNCSKLEWLSLRNCIGVTDDAVVEFLLCLSSLKSLNVSGCKKLTDEILFAVLERGRRSDCYQLEALDLSMCGKLKGAPLVQGNELMGLRNIKELDLRNCEEFSKEAVFKVFETLTMLEKVSISGIEGFDESLKELIWMRNSNLKFLNV